MEYAEFIEKATRGTRLLGFDVGSKTVGVAVSDISWMIATPLKTLKRGVKFAPLLAEIVALQQAEQAGGIVIGLPLHLNGEDTPQTQSVRAFARNISGAIEVPITFWDERWSTCAAENAMLLGDLSRKRRAAMVDKVAASYILQGFLNRIHQQR